MKELAGNQRPGEKEKTRQSGIQGPRTDMLQPLSHPATITSLLTGKHEEKLTSSPQDRAFAQAPIKTIPNAEDPLSLVPERGQGERLADALPLRMADLGSEFLQTSNPVRRSRQRPISLEEVPILSNYEQYAIEMHKISRLTDEEERVAVQQARNGDLEARNTLLITCLPVIVHIASRYYVHVPHEDILDLVGVGNLAITEKFDLALTKEKPVPYLFAVADREISNYCLYRARPMPMKNPTHLDLSTLPPVISLDAPLRGEDGKFRQVAAPEQKVPDADKPALKMVRQALGELIEKQREVVEMRHGFEDTGSLKFDDIAEILATNRSTIDKRYRTAIKHLRRMLFTNETQNTQIT